VSRRLDGDFVIWLALGRVHRGGVTKVGDRFCYRRQPMPPGLLVLALDALIEGGLADPEGGATRVSLTDAGVTCYAQLSAQQRAGLATTETPAGRPGSSSAPLDPCSDRSGVSEPAFFELLALRRVHDGGVTTGEDGYLQHGRVITGQVAAALDRLIQTEYLALARPSPDGLNGTVRYYRTAHARR
jgi:hypothetical protein